MSQHIGRSITAGGDGTKPRQLRRPTTVAHQSRITLYNNY